MSQMYDVINVLVTSRKNRILQFVYQLHLKLMLQFILAENRVKIYRNKATRAKVI